MEAKVDKDGKIIAVIPARGGSKRIPRKNIRSFCGKPIIAYSITAALESNLFDAVYVSTEDPEIAKTSLEWGANIIDRPINLADDFTPTIPVIRQAISWYEQNVTELSSVCCIYPTVPLLTPQDLREGYKVHVRGEWSFVFSATEYSYPIQRAFEILDGGGIQMGMPQHFNTRTQDVKIMYHDADKFYWGGVSAWNNEEIMFSKKSTAVVIPQERVRVIDDEKDWIQAEKIYHQSKSDLHVDKYLNIIDQIENVRSVNNVNWMDVLRLAFRHAPEEAKKLSSKINQQDKEVSELLGKLTEEESDDL